MRYRGSMILAAAQLLIALSPSGHSRLFAQTPDLNELEKVIAAELKETSTPGAAVAVVSGDRVVFLKGFGIASVETNLPITPQSLFYSGGLSSLFTATALVSLAEKGRIDLNAPAGRYVAGLSPKLARLTAHQLLTSTAGLKEEHQRHGLIDDSALADLIRSFDDDRIFTEPGRIYSGSHPSYVLAGRVLEAAAGKPFADVVAEHVFEPLGMTRSTYRILQAVTYPFSQGYERDSQGNLRLYQPFAGNSVGLPRNSFYSVSDAARFLIALINGGKLDDRQVLPASVVSKLLTPYFPTPGASREQVGYGVSFSKIVGQSLLGVSTSWGGVTTIIRIVPDERFAVIVMANGDTRFDKTAQKAVELLVPSFRQASAPARQLNPIPPAQAAGYAGTYENERVIRLFVKDGELLMRDETKLADLGSLTDGAEWIVTKSTDDSFVASERGNGRSLRFAIIEGGKIGMPYIYVGTRALMRAMPIGYARSSIDNAVSVSADSVAIAALEQRSEDASVRGDAAYLEGLYAPGFIFTHFGGRSETKDEMLTAMRQRLRSGAVPAIKMLSRSLDSVNVEVHGNIALTSGRMHVRHDGGNSEQREYVMRYVRVYAREKGRWQLLTHRSVGETRIVSPSH